MKKLLIPTIMVVVSMLLVGCGQTPAVTTLSHYTIQPLENDRTLLVVDLKDTHTIANATRALNDIAAHYGKIIGTPSSLSEMPSGTSYHYNPTTHLFVRIEPFNPPRTMAGSAPYPNSGAPSRAGTK
jgi:hypothetical protein